MAGITRHVELTYLRTQDRQQSFFLWNFSRCRTSERFHLIRCDVALVAGTAENKSTTRIGYVRVKQADVYVRRVQQTTRF